MYPAVELRLLRYVVAVVETLNFGRAAQRLNTSQPSLSKQILGLEDYLGYKLFQRNKRWVEITPDASSLKTPARHCTMPNGRSHVDGLPTNRNMKLLLWDS